MNTDRFYVAVRDEPLLDMQAGNVLRLTDGGAMIGRIVSVEVAEIVAKVSTSLELVDPETGKPLPGRPRLTVSRGGAR